MSYPPGYEPEPWLTEEQEAYVQEQIEEANDLSRRMWREREPEA